jgi:hypothetical protein
VDGMLWGKPHPLVVTGWYDVAMTSENYAGPANLLTTFNTEGGLGIHPPTIFKLAA